MKIAKTFPRNYQRKKEHTLLTPFPAQPRTSRKFLEFERIRFVFQLWDVLVRLGNRLCVFEMRLKIRLPLNQLSRSIANSMGQPFGQLLEVALIVRSCVIYQRVLFHKRLIFDSSHHQLQLWLHQVLVLITRCQNSIQVLPTALKTHRSKRFVSIKANATSQPKRSYRMLLRDWTVNVVCYNFNFL